VVRTCAVSKAPGTSVLLITVVISAASTKNGECAEKPMQHFVLVQAG
jgi:hypothetical protein